jgi:NAD dependent epimerase/dehydratase
LDLGNLIMAARILVTGADGFIGSHLIEQLVREGYDVRAFVYYNSFNSWGWLDSCSKDVTDNVEVVAGDIRDASGVNSAVKGCSHILHLAALIAIPFSYTSPDAYVQTNVTGTLNVLQSARENNIEHLVCTSTSETYGSAQFVPISEDHPLNAQSPYAATKIAADQMALAFQRSFDLPVSILRPFNTFGPRQSARAVIPTVIGQLASGADQVQLGSVYPTRDFTYVTDTARGFIQILNNYQCVGEVTNIGTGFEISIADTVDLIAEVMNVAAEVKQREERERPLRSEVDRLVACTQKARELIGWNPEFAGRAGLKEGLAQTAKWFQDPVNLARYKNSAYNL